VKQALLDSLGGMVTVLSGNIRRLQLNPGNRFKPISWNIGAQRILLSGGLRATAAFVSPTHF
jgi:hypothetical protein